VGGGYPKDQLARVSLKWMMTHSSQAGLKFDDDVRKLYEMESDEFGKLYDSRSSLGSFYRYKPRSIENLSREVGIDPSGKTSKPKEEMRRLPLIHASAIRRIAHTTRGYSPPGLPSAGEYAQVDFVTDPESGERMNKRWHQKDLVPLSEEGAEAAPDCFVAEYESFGPDNKTNIRSYTRQLTAGLLSFRRDFFYALYLWVFAFLGAIFWSQSRGISQGHWKDAHGDEKTWKDASYDAGPEGILKKPSSMMSIFGSQKRLPSAKYFHLLGSIGKASSKPFLVKDGIPFTAHETGELFLFVNDLPGFYGNNTGKSQLRIMLVGGGR